MAKCLHLLEVTIGVSWHHLWPGQGIRLVLPSDRLRPTPCGTASCSRQRAHEPGLSRPRGYPVMQTFSYWATNLTFPSHRNHHHRTFLTLTNQNNLQFYTSTRQRQTIAGLKNWKYSSNTFWRVCSVDSIHNSSGTELCNVWLCVKPDSFNLVWPVIDISLKCKNSNW